MCFVVNAECIYINNVGILIVFDHDDDDDDDYDYDDDDDYYDDDDDDDYDDVVFEPLVIWQPAYN